MLYPEHLEYLLSRGYTEEMAKKEPIESLPTGLFEEDGIKFKPEEPVIMWRCYATSGQLIGLQTRRTDIKEYRWFLHPKSPHLPIIYGTDEDFDLLYQSGTMILTEGCFDRAAVKRALPDKAVFGRLSKGAGLQLTHFLRRYAKTLFLAFDMDEKGQAGGEKAEQRLRDKVETHTLKYPAKDPAEFLKKAGIGKVRDTLSRQIDAAV